MTDTYKDAIDIKSIADNWPANHDMPTIISDLGQLMSPWPWGVLGHWRLNGERFDAFWANWCRQGANLDGEFGIFMEFASGRKYAVWYHQQDAAGSHPIVDFGDEGGVKILAANMKDFFMAWASGRGVGWLEPFEYEATPAVVAERKACGAQMLSLINAMPQPPTGLAREVLQARLDATVAAAQTVADEAERQKRLTEIYGDKIDLVSPEKFWPIGRSYPQIISQMGALLKPLIVNSVGRCEMIGHRMPDTWIYRGADLHTQFGFFLVDHAYRSVALWYHGRSVPGFEPVVDFRSMIFDADDDAKVVAPNLKAYFTMWVEAVARGDQSYGLNEEPEIVAQRPALVRKMRDLIDAMPHPPLLDEQEPTTAGPAFVSFIRRHIAQERARDLADPILQDMATLLRSRFPAQTEALWNSIFVTAKGNEFEFSLTAQEVSEDTFPEGRALTPLLIQARKARAQGPTAALGLWTSSQLQLYPDGRIALLAYWD
jgi:hypothetical protein